MTRPSVTPVTKREFRAKKGLLLPKTSLHLTYHLDPVQGPAGSRFREVLPLPNPEARFLVFGAKFDWPPSAHLMARRRMLFARAASGSSQRRRDEECE